MDIKLNYSYNKAQIKRAFRYQGFPTPNAKWFMLFITVFIFSVSGLFVFFANKNHVLIPIAKIILIICSTVWFIVLLAVAYSYFYVSNKLIESPVYLGNFSLILSDVGLLYKQDFEEENNKINKEALINWSSFTKKAENDEFIFLYQNKILSVLPKKDFNKQTELQEFRSFLSRQAFIKTKKYNGKELWSNL